MLSTSTTATSQEIENLFGRPTGSAGTGLRIAAACKYGWFDVVNRGESPHRYRALPKKEKSQLRHGPRTDGDKPFFAIGRNAQPWPSVWAYASQGASE